MADSDSDALAARAGRSAMDRRQLAQWWRALLRDDTWASVMIASQRGLQEITKADVVSLWAQLPPTGHWLRVAGKARGELVLPPGSSPLGELLADRRPQRVRLADMSVRHRRAFDRAGLRDGWFVPVLAPAELLGGERWVGAVGLGWREKAPEEPPSIADVAPALWYLMRQQVERTYTDALLESILPLGPPISDDGWRERMAALRAWLGGEHWALYRAAAGENGAVALSLVTEDGGFAGRGMRLVRFMRDRPEVFATSALLRALTQRRNVYIADTGAESFRIADEYGGEPVRSGFVIPLGDDGQGSRGLLGVYWAEPDGWRAFGLSAQPWDALRRVAADWWANMRTSQQAMSDALTGLLNRRGVADHWHATVHHATIGVLGIVDLDHFGEVNNRWGHLVGDEVLRVLSRILQAVAADHGGWCGRWGGDEFVLALDADCDWTQVGATVQRSLDAAASLSKWPQRVTVSGGATSWRAGEADWAQTFERADQALYRAKQRGRARFLAAARAHPRAGWGREA